MTDQGGKPLGGSEFELVVADEAVLALGGYELPDPMQAFYPELPNVLNAVYGRSTVTLANPPPQSQRAPAGVTSAASSAAASGGAPAAAVPATPMSATATDSASVASGGKLAGPGAPIAQRQNFDALALFVPSATTNAQGRATISVKLPDSLTRYRVMVVAVAGDNEFGSAESTITAALPLTVRPSAPTFLNFGDRLELPVLLQNQTDAPLTTDVVIQAANLKVTGAAGQQVTVPARGRIEVRFPVAADQAGTAKFRVAAVSGAAADAASIELPVYTPTTTETFAAYGVLNGGTTLRQKVTAPKGVVDQFGGLEISTSSTALQQLTDAVGYLADYDYDSSDGLAAQIIAIGSLGDVLKAFSAPGLPSPDALKALVAADVAKLVALQNDDGGFPYWRHGDKSDPFNSIQSTQALLVAVDQGFVVSKDSLDRADQYLAGMNSHIPADASQATKDTLRAYALNVRMQAGHRDAAGAQRLAAERGDQLALDAVAWLLPVVTDATTRAALERRVSNAAVDDAGSATFANAVTDDAWTTLQSDRRTDGLILDALIAVQPTSDLIPKIVSGLMAGQTDGRWANVQENAFILLALRHYYDAFESASADFVAGVWLGDRFAGQHQFTGHTTERATVSIPTSVLVGPGNDDVTVQNDRHRAALLPAWSADRADQSEARPAGPGVRRVPHLHRRRRPRRRHPRRDRHLAHQVRCQGQGETGDGVPERADPRRADRSAARRVADPQPRPGHHVEGSRPQVRRLGAAHQLVLDLVRPPEPAGRPGRGVRHLSAGRRVRLQLPGQGHHRRHLRRPTHPGRAGLRPGDLRPRRLRSGGDRQLIDTVAHPSKLIRLNGFAAQVVHRSATLGRGMRIRFHHRESPTATAMISPPMPANQAARSISLCATVMWLGRSPRATFSWSAFCAR